MKLLEPMVFFKGCTSLQDFHIHFREKGGIMAKILIGFLSFSKFVIRNDKGIASFGPMNILTGIGVLGLSFSFVAFSGLQSTQIAQSVSTIQIQGPACTLGGTETTVLLYAQEAALEALGEKINGE